MNYLKSLYHNRFSETELINKNKIWTSLCESFFSRYIHPEDVVVDIGAGYCEFLNNINARGKIAIDINPDTHLYANQDVRVISDDCKNIKSIPANTVDVVFASNFLEHLNDKAEILLTLKECHKILKHNGLIIIMGPNIKYLSKIYWDFFDHKIPLSHLSLIEILPALGFSLKKVYRKFLPYTTKSKLPKFNFLIKFYIKIPICYNLFGKQFLIIGQKNEC